MSESPLERVKRWAEMADEVEKAIRDATNIETDVWATANQLADELARHETDLRSEA